MRAVFYGSFFLLLCMLPMVHGFLGPSGAACFASNKKEYLSKTTIDTLVQQAFVNLNASTGTDIPDAEARHRQALADAKETAAKLKDRAKGDPNEKYVLWKVNELEYQIFLEERDAVLKTKEKDKKAENTRIAAFNKELGKKRPDFIALALWCNDMKAMDQAKEKEMRRSLNQRSDALTRDVIMTIEKALFTGDLAVSQREFDYCDKNRSGLKIPPEKFSWFAMKIPAQIEAMRQKGPIDQELAIAGPFLSHNRIGILRKNISEAQGTLYRIQDDLPAKDKTFYTKKINVLLNAVNRKEDSLVLCCFSILKAKGDDAALDYLELVLKPLGVSEEKIGQTTATILHKSGFAKKGIDTALSRQLDVISNTNAPENNGNGINLADVRIMAKKKAQEKADSLRGIEPEQKSDVNYEKAKQVITQIYGLIEVNEIEAAYKRFVRVRKPLEKYCDKEVFAILESTVVQAYESLGKRGR